MKDLIIIGGSIAATAAGVYAARRKLDFEIITKEFGGEVATSGEIGNWPGMVSVQGTDLSGQFKEHLQALSVPLTEGVEVTKIERTGSGFITHARSMNVAQAADKEKQGDENGITYESKAVLVATGVHPRHLGIPGEEEFFQKGVTYCTTCDGPIFAGKTVVTIGGGNTGAESVIMLSEIAQKVYWISNADAVKAEPILVDKIKAAENVEIIYNADTKEIKGETFVKQLLYTDNKTNEEKSLDLDGVFVHIGMIPNSDLVPEEVEKDKFKQIVVDERGQTSVPGLFAAGDVTSVPFKQITIAAGQSVTALLQIVSYLNTLK